MSEEIPSINQYIDSLGIIEEQIEELHKAEKDLNKQKDEIENYLFATFNKSDIEGVYGTSYIAFIEKKHYPKVNDWDAVHNWIAENAAYDLYYKRIGELAWKERVEAGVEIPGIEDFVKEKIKLKKR